MAGKAENLRAHERWDGKLLGEMGWSLWQVFGSTLAILGCSSWCELIF